MNTYTQPVVGWRLWKVGPDAGALQSTFMAHDWPTKTAEARHLGALGPSPFGFVPPGAKSAASVRNAPDCKPPKAGHQCGFNAYSTLEKAVGKNRSSSTNRWQTCYVFGAIAGFGKVILHECGFRCSRARVLCLIETDQLDLHQDDLGMLTPETWLKRMCKVAEVYSVPLLPWELAVEYVASEGVSVDDYRGPER